MPRQVLTTFFAAFAIACGGRAQALIYEYGPWNTGAMDPQPSGWPLTDAERTYVTTKAEFQRRPGAEASKYLPTLWPVVPAAGHWGSSTPTAWLDTHTKLVNHVNAFTSATPTGKLDVLLVGDSITQQWGSTLDNKPLNAAWQSRFGQYTALNIGIGGDKIQNVLWRLDHGGVAGLDPRVVVLMIGNNNMFYVGETTHAAVAKGVRVTVNNLREKFPNADIIVTDILPAHSPGNAFYENIKLTNTAIANLNLAAMPNVHVLPMWNDYVNADGTRKSNLFLADNIHLSQPDGSGNDGYSLYAAKLDPVITALVPEPSSITLVAIAGLVGLLALHPRTLRRPWPQTPLPSVRIFP